MQRIFTAHPALEREQSKNQQCRPPDPEIAQRGKRQRTQNRVCDQRHCQATHKPLPRKSPTQYWCTGKDSNLRTSLGGTDLQSVGFNHSPTCAKPQGDAVVRSIRRAIKHNAHLPPRTGLSQTKFSQTQFSQTGFRKLVSQITFRKSGKPRIAPTDYRAKITTSRIKLRMECVGKTCCAATYRVLPPAGIRVLKNRFRTFAYWSWRRDLNPRPPDYKSGALPTELRQHSGNRALQAQVYP
jgi:hypothetical protein